MDGSPLSDTTYDLLCILTEAMDTAYAVAQAAADAERRGDDELAGVFREVEQADRDTAERSRAMLAARL